MVMTKMLVLTLAAVVYFAPLAKSQVPAPPPVRPSSDSALAPEGQAGTNFLVPQMANRPSPQELEQVLQQRRESHPHVQLVLPTSDRSNDTESRFRDLQFQIDARILPIEQLNAYTNFAVPRYGDAAPQLQSAPKLATTPNTIRKLYGVPATGGTGVIAVVSAFHYPNVIADLNTFSQAYDLPRIAACPATNPYAGQGPCLRVVPSSQAAISCSWNQESAADLEWIHAIAPYAKLLFVEAASNHLGDLFAAVAVARDEVKPFGGEVSMSWSTEKEALQETQSDLQFQSTFTDGVLYFAATGDTGGQVAIPATFPNVIAVGGTSLLFALNGNLLAESGWKNSGGGVSKIVTLVPPYQVGVENLLAGGRNVPDIAAVADADYQDQLAMVAYVSTPKASCVDQPTSLQYNAGWMPMVGTSLSTPIIAAIPNVAAQKQTTTLSELSAIYKNRKDPSKIKDITLTDGSAGGNQAKQYYDNVTGVGVPASIDFDKP
jgi:kumamolisin